jgi:chromosome segregation ATPase
MVQTDISQFCAEAADWRQILRNYRDEFSDCKKSLQEMCRRDLSKNQLQEIEHFDNQFHIQLINIHDVKQQIKGHEKRIRTDLSSSDQVTEDTYSEHEKLLDEFLTLENTLQELRNDFRKFINDSSC